jgi:hypothetical protein
MLGFPMGLLAMVLPCLTDYGTVVDDEECRTETIRQCAGTALLAPSCFPTRSSVPRRWRLL